MLIVTWQVKEIMQKAFWDLLEQQLEADPPQYTQVRSKSWDPSQFTPVDNNPLLSFDFPYASRCLFSGPHSSH